MNILVFKEKHGDRYMKASFNEEIQQSCWKVLKERMEDEWYSEPEEPVKPVCSREDAEKLPDPYREAALRGWELYDRDFRQYQRDKKWFDRAKQEIENPDDMAWELLNWRRDYQYEGIEIVRVE